MTFIKNDFWFKMLKHETCAGKDNKLWILDLPVDLIISYTMWAVISCAFLWLPNFAQNKKKIGDEKREEKS